MKLWKTVALAAALTSAAGLGASLAPAALAQPRTRVSVAPQAEVFSIYGGSRIGVSVRDVEATDKSKTANGVVIESVDEESPASKAALKAGDIVVEFDGERVRSVRQFSRLVSETPDGRTVAAAVMRDGQRVSVNITPAAGNSALRFFDAHGFKSIEPLLKSVPPPTPRPARPAPLPPTLERFFWNSGTQLGITISDLEPQLAEYFGTKDGVLVSSVNADSAAAKAGLKAGDVITAVNDTKVTSASDLRSRLRNLEAGEFALLIIRNKQPMALKGKLEVPAERRRTTARTIL
jgi:serine protease Do